MVYIHKETFDIIQWSNIPNLLDDEYFEVDDFIALPIQELNRKGYTTKYSCTGHPFKGLVHLYFIDDEDDKEKCALAEIVPDAKSYIAFKQGIILPTIPEGFYVDEEDEDFTIRADDELEVYVYNFFQKSLDQMRKLFSWAVGLPERKES